MEKRAFHTYNCQSKGKKKTASVPDVVKGDMDDVIVKLTHGAATIVSTSTCATLQPMVIPQIAIHNLTSQVEEHESREHSWKSPQSQMKEVRSLMSKQFPHQMSCQDIRMDPRYQKPPQYAEINHHRVSPQTPVEVNEFGPTIQQGVIQCPVQRHTQAAGEQTR